VAVDDQVGGVVLADIGTLPDGADLTAWYRFPTGDQLMAFDTTLDLNIYKGLHRKPPGPSCCGAF
jgi:hypothetical protein